jgi:hypothetical protein
MSRKRDDRGMTLGGKVLLTVIIIVLIILAWMCGAKTTAHAVAGFFDWWVTFFRNLRS